MKRSEAYADIQRAFDDLQDPIDDLIGKIKNKDLQYEEVMNFAQHLLCLCEDANRHCDRRIEEYEAEERE